MSKLTIGSKQFWIWFALTMIPFVLLGAILESLRLGSITKHLREVAPEEVVSDRMNVSRSVFGRHYDRRSEHERAETRREFIDDAK